MIYYISFLDRTQEFWRNKLQELLIFYKIVNFDFAITDVGTNTPAHLEVDFSALYY